MSHKGCRLQIGIASLPCIKQAVGIDFLPLEVLMHKWECLFEILMKGVKDIPSLIDADFSLVIERLCLDLDGARETLDAGVEKCGGGDEGECFG
jgi:hypothetical protein